jgi:hypothetical protein
MDFQPCEEAAMSEYLSLIVVVVVTKEWMFEDSSFILVGADLMVDHLYQAE